jgi:hemolysin activation/secretion protein
MNKKRLTLLVVLLSAVISLPNLSFSAPPTSQEAGGQERMREMQEIDKRLREKVEQPKVAPQVEENLPQETRKIGPSEKVLIQKINVTDVTLLSQSEIAQVIAPFENKELDMREMQKVADLVTDVYRQKGYITSRAFLPPQKIDTHVLEIRVIEGKMGEIDVRGNRFLKTSLIKRWMKFVKGEVFNYNKLRRALSRLNQKPDRNVSAVLSPGKEQGETDVILEVKDRFPVHIGMEWDNFGSRYVRRNRYQATLKDNNLLGLDDVLTIQYQRSDGNSYRLNNLWYIIPVSETTEAGFFASYSTLRLGREFEDLDAHGYSKIFGIFATQKLIDKDDITLNLNLGFDYKDIFNYQLDEETSRDRLRIVKVGLDLDVSDGWGRTILSNEIDTGIPHIMGGLQKKDPHASRVGVGGQFVKDSVNLLRWQKMPFSSNLLVKNQAQFSPYVLTAAEQFQLGGVANVRAYPPAEFVGDEGYAMTAEWSIPPYGVPKTIKVPFSKATIYDAFRIVAFYDIGVVRLFNPQAGEEKNETIKGYGCGFRINLPESFSVRMDFAWPIGRMPSDGKREHTWVRIYKEF